MYFCKPTTKFTAIPRNKKFRKSVHLNINMVDMQNPVSFSFVQFCGSLSSAALNFFKEQRLDFMMILSRTEFCKAKVFACIHTTIYFFEYYSQHIIFQRNQLLPPHILFICLIQRMSDADTRTTVFYLPVSLILQHSDHVSLCGRFWMCFRSITKLFPFWTRNHKPTDMSWKSLETRLLRNLNT